MNSFSDSILFFLVRGLSRLLCFLPLSVALWIGRRVGDLAFFFYPRRGEVAYANLKECLGEARTPLELLRLEREVFQNLMQTAVEVLRFPKVNKAYLNRYVTIQGLEHLASARQKGKGAIALTAHFGNWELQSVAAALRGYPTQVLAREQKFPRTNALLNHYRELTGCKVIHKGFMTRQIIQHLRANGLVGILTDQDAGEKGVFVNFFGRPTSFAPGPIAFALKTGCDVIPCFIRRQRHAHHAIEITETLRITPTGNEKEDIRRGLQQFAERLETYIRKSPDQWLWLHKRWKSSPSRRIAVLSDGKAGHLNQSLGISASLQNVLEERNLLAGPPARLDIRFKQRWRRILLAAFSLQANRRCQGCLKCVRFALTKESYDQLLRSRHDFIISAGSSLAPVNRILSLENRARAIVSMDPVIPPATSFDLAIVPEHDHPPLSDRVVVTDGALHFLTEEKVKEEALKLSAEVGKEGRPFLGLLIGGESEDFQWHPEEFSTLVELLNREARRKNFDLLVTTSRRTSKSLEELLEASWGNDPRCKLLVLANQKNREGIVAGILGLSKVVLVTGESVSMVSEAATVAERLVVLLPEKRKKNSKVEITLSQLAKANHLLLTEQKGLGETLERAFAPGAARTKLKDTLRIQEALRRIL